MHKVRGDREDDGKRRRQAEKQSDDQPMGSAVPDRPMQGAPTGSQDPKGSRHRGKRQSEEEYGEERDQKER